MARLLPVPKELQHLLEKRELEDRRGKDRRAQGGAAVSIWARWARSSRPRAWMTSRPTSGGRGPNVANRRAGGRRPAAQAI